MDDVVSRDDHFPVYPYATVAPEMLTPGTPTLDIPPPGGIITFVYQQTTAQDNDILFMRPLDLSPDLLESRSEAALDAGLIGLAQVADALTPGDFTLAREVTDTKTRIHTLRETFAGVDPEDAPDGAQVTNVGQQQATLPDSGILINGAAADAVPSTLADALAAGESGETGEEETDLTPVEDDAEDGVVVATVVIGPDDTGPHTDALQFIEAGNTPLMTSAVSGLAPVDAQLIAVAGAAMSLTVITQVNIMSDRDTLVGPGVTP